MNARMHMFVPQETVTDMATFMTQYDVAVVEHPKTGL